MALRNTKATSNNTGGATINRCFPFCASEKRRFALGLPDHREPPFILFIRHLKDEQSAMKTRLRAKSKNITI